MIAEELAKKQKEISIAEFFEKNKHILGYSNPAKSIITCVKEAVDNALDACEEAGILPDIFVKISRVDRGNYKIVVEDNGPGIIKEQIPKVFGKLLYGSRFHAIRQSRGQQGIGISAAVLYAQLTTGKPVTIISKTDKAWKIKLFINTRKNEPEVVSEEQIEWHRARGTRIELEIAGVYVKERKQSVFEYLRETSIVNPHAKITFIDPDGEMFEFPRVVEELPAIPKEIKPHPHGIELGMLMGMLRYTSTRELKNFLMSEFVRVGEKTVKEVLLKAGFDGKINPKSLSREESINLLNAFRQTEFLPPPVDCLSAIGENLIMHSLMSEYKAEWVYAVTRKPKVYAGHPFLVEVGIAYGGEISCEKVNVLRYANKIPLLYQQSGCALTKAVESINWRNYGLQQTKDELPTGAAIVLIHLASTNIPYTSESKEAIAAIPEIMDEVRLCLQEVGRKLREYVERKERLQKKRKKEDILNKILPLLAKKVCEVLEKDPLDIEKIVARIVGNVYVERRVFERDGWLDVRLIVSNFTKSKKEVKIYEMCSGDVEAEDAKLTHSTYTTLMWRLVLETGKEVELKYKVRGKVINRKPLVEGIEGEVITGGEVMFS
jgi:DNA topoisomerase-6 subunit B